MKKTFKFLTCLFVAILCFGQVWATDYTLSASSATKNDAADPKSHDWTFSTQTFALSPQHGGVGQTGYGEYIKFSKNKTYTITLPTGFALTNINIKGYTNANGATNGEIIEVNGTTQSSKTFPAKDDSNLASATQITTGYDFAISQTGSTVTFKTANTNQICVLITISGTPACSAPTSPAISGKTSYTAGENISLTASATGATSATFTWYKGATWDAASATSSIGTGATFTKNSCEEGDAGTYWCNISNGTGCEVQVSQAITVAAATTTYKVTLVPAGGTISDATGWTLNAGNYEKEIPDGAELTLPTFTKANRTFKTWRNAVPADVTSPITVTGDVTLTAVWAVTFENVLYSWESDGTVSETGGTATSTTNGGSSFDNAQLNVSQGDYHCIQLNGKNDYSTNYVQITLSGEEKVKAGDKIRYTGFYKHTDTKNAAPTMRALDGTTIFQGSNLPNINSASPRVDTHTVPDGINTATVQLTRYQTQSSSFLTKLQIIRETLVEEANLRTVTFNYNDGGATASTTVEVASGSTVAEPADPTWAHHRFNEWQLSGSAYDFSTPVTSNITLTADWTQLYTVTYAKGAEDATGTAPTQDELAAGEKFDVAANTFTYAGHNFSTWNDGSNDYDPGDEYTMGSANVTLTAQWVEGATEYAITKGSLTNGDITINPASQEAGEDVTITVTPATGYVLSGSITVTGDVSGNAVTATDNGDGTWTFEMPAEDVTVSATFATAHTLSYNKNGGSGDAMDNTVGAGSITLRKNSYTKDDYVFIGWATSSDNAAASTVAYLDGASYSLSADAELFAVWSPESYSFTPKTVESDEAINDGATVVTSAGGTMVNNSETDDRLVYTAQGLAFKSSGKCKVTVTIDGVIKEGTVFTATFAAFGDGAGRGVKLNINNSDKATWTWNPAANLEEKTFQWKVPASDSSIGLNEFKLVRSANVYLKSLTVTNTAEPTADLPAADLAYDPTSVSLTVGGTFTPATLTYATGFDGLAAVTYESSNTNLAIVNAAGEVSLVADATGTATITATFAGNDNYLAGSASYTITVNKAGDDLSGTWTLASAVAAGDQIIIGATKNSDTYAMGKQNSDNRAAVASTLDGTTLTPGAATKVLTLVDAGDGKFAIKTSDDKYLTSATSGTSNNLLEATDYDLDNAKWTISIDGGGVASIVAAAGNKTIMQYNNGSKIFSCYGSASQTDVNIYKKTAQPDPDYTEVRNGLTAGWYYTMCLEKAVTAVRGGSIWRVLSKAQNGSDVILEEVTGDLDAGRPYIFYATAATLEVVYTGDAVGAPVTAGNNGLVGSFSQELIEQSPNNYILYNNALYYVNSDNVYVGANRAYLDMEGVPDYSTQQEGNAPRRRVTMTVHSKDVATDVDAINSSEKPMKLMIDGQLFILRGEKMYDATGRLVK